MTVVTWAWKGQVMTDYFPYQWLKFSKHFKGISIWSLEFHWKGSKTWYHNFRRRYTSGGSVSGGFTNTRLTLRFGKHIVSVGYNDTEEMYKDVVLLKMTCKGKVVFDVLDELKFADEFQYVEVAVDASEEDIREAIEEMKKSYYYLSKDYPSDTWRN